MYSISMDDIQNLMSRLFLCTSNYAPAWSSRWGSRTWRGLYKRRSWPGGGKRRRWSTAYGGPRESLRCTLYYNNKIVINVSNFTICRYRTCENWLPCSSQHLAKVISFVRQSAVVHLLNIVIIIIPYIKLFSDIVYYQNVINVITKPSNWRSRASKNKSNVSSNGYYGITWMGWKWLQAGCRCWAGAKLWRTPGSLHTNMIKVNCLIFKTV